jgi:uncharacterized protein (TIGR02284 family)
MAPSTTRAGASNSQACAKEQPLHGMARDLQSGRTSWPREAKPPKEVVMSERTELEVLNHLLEICRDSEHGFKAAAQRVTDSTIRDLFRGLAAERARFAQELAPHVHRLGGQAATDGTAAGALHRSWINVRSAVSRHHDEAVLDEAERGERAAAYAYREALAGMLPPAARDVIEKQYAAIAEAQARIGALVMARTVGV